MAWKAPGDMNVKLIVTDTGVIFLSSGNMRFNCIDDDTYDGQPGNLMGWGSTEILAVEDYLEQLKDREEEEELNLIHKDMDPQTGVLDE